MEETEQLSNLIGNIYDAVLEPTLWTGVVEKAGSFVGGSGAPFFLGRDPPGGKFLLQLRRRC